MSFQLLGICFGFCGQDGDSYVESKAWVVDFFQGCQDPKCLGIWGTSSGVNRIRMTVCWGSYLGRLEIIKVGRISNACEGSLNPTP